MSDAPPQVILISGPNGAGKSTLAPFLLKDSFGVMEFVNADTIALGLSAYRPESVAFEAGRVMLARLRALAAQRVSFAFESTLASRSYSSWLNRVQQEGYEFHLIYLWLRHPDLAVQRVTGRVQAGGHAVLEHIVRRRYVRGAANFFRVYRKLADTWTIYDNSFHHEPALIAIGGRHISEKIFDVNLWRQFHEVSV